MVDKVKKELCTGCSACHNLCPINCIQMVEDGTGFKYPKINHNKCLHCNKCSQICPILNKPKIKDKYESPKVFAAWSLDEYIRLQSTSGGVFTELAKQIISKGGYVVGAIYNDKQLVEHYMINQIEDIEKLRQSKYIQSDINDIFKQVKEKLTKDKLVAFCGTPCQVAGLLKFLDKDYDNLITFDFICRGVNSPKAYSKYIEMLENQYNSKVKRVWFKNKTYGWNNFATRIDFENGEHYIQDRNTDLFMIGYIKKNFYMRESCFSCQYKNLPRMSDITLADFWGVKKELDNNQGTSLVIINSAKGFKLFNDINNNVFYKESSIKEALPGNACLLKSAIKNIESEKFLKLLDKYSFDICFEKIREKG